MSKIIKLTQGQVALVSDQDYEWLTKWKWYAHKTKGDSTFYVVRSEKVNGKSKMVIMHREILGISDPKIKGDHIDRNGLNNQRSNLRIVSNSQSAMNRGPFRETASKYKGVFLKKGNKYKIWGTQIIKEGELFFIGYFVSEIEAAIAYNKKAIELHGEFATLNIL